MLRVLSASAPSDKGDEHNMHKFCNGSSMMTHVGTAFPREKTQNVARRIQEDMKEGAR